jgi:phage terminase large subunit
MTSAEKSIIPEFKNIASRLGLSHNFHYTQNMVKNKRNDSFVLFSGIKTSSGDQTANLKSIAGITTWVIEEGEDFTDEKAFNTIDDSIRSQKHQNRVIWIQNPTTKEHFIYDRMIAPANKQIDVHGYNVTVSALHGVEHIHSSYHIAKQYLEQSWLDKANKYRIEADDNHAIWLDAKGEEGIEKHNSYYYHNYIGGWLERAEGVIFENWTEGEFDTSLPYAYGLDFGYFPDPTALVKIAVDSKRKRIYLQELLYEYKLGTDEIINAVRAQVENPRALIVADSAEKRTIADMSSARLNVIPAVKGPDSVRAGLVKMQDYEIIVAPGGHNLKKELNNYVWNDKKSTTPIDDYNHLIDAARYAFMRLVAKQGSGVRRRN